MKKRSIFTSSLVCLMMLANISSAGYMTPAQEYFEPSEKAITFEASTQSDSSVESSQESSKATQQQAI